MLRKILLIANKHAGRGAALKMMQRAKRSIWGYDCDFHLTESEDDVEKLFNKTDINEYKAVVCFGGDGTFNTLLKYVMGKSPILIPIPTGSANDLATEHGITESWEDITEAIEENSFKLVDVLTVNAVPFITAGGIGIGSELVGEYNSMREKSALVATALTRFKSGIYRFLAVKNILSSFKVVRGGAEIHLKGKEKHIELSSKVIFITNQNNIAGNMKISNDSDTGDGKFELVIVPNKGRKYILETMNDMYLGKIRSSVECYKCESLKLDLSDEMEFYGDGEILSTSRCFEIELIPSAVKLISLASGRKK